LAVGLAASEALGQIPDFSGRPIVDLIEALRDQGIRIIYSEDLVSTRLRVLVEPSTDDTLEGLREILNPHGLDVEAGPRDTWLVVQQAKLPDTPTPGEPPPEPLIVTRPSLETVIVMASRYSINRPSAISASTIGRHTLESTPALGQDPLRVPQGLPGVTGNQLTSRIHIRGGRYDEVLLKLDGVRLYSPYHLKDFQNFFSSINPRVIESMDIRTGGYEARFGDRMSGVVDMKSITPTDFRHHEIGVSLLETSVLSSGLFDNGRGSWVTALRRGNLDVISEAVDSDVGKPQYVDFFNKLEYALSPRWKVAAGMFSLDDKVTLNDGSDATASAGYDDAYFWLSLDQNAESGLEAAYRISFARLERQRIGNISDPNKVIGSLSERGKFDRQDLSADWGFPLSETRRIDWGLELSRSELNHDFQANRTVIAPIAIDELSGQNAPPAAALVRLEQSQFAFYTSFRVQPVRRLVTEFGLRWDEQTLTNESQLSPRLNMLFNISNRTSIRAAWGEFNQSQPLNEVAIADGMTDLQSAEESEHVIVGIEQLIGDTITLRFEAYTKNVETLNVRYENVFERASLIPELLPDRFAIQPVGAKIYGAEFSIDGEQGAYSWWGNISRGRTSERLASGQFKRSWDELLSIKAGGEWSGPFWTITANATFRSGWPISTLRLDNDQLVSDSFNGLRLPDYSSVDVRAGRMVPTRHGELNWYIEINNLFNHDNDCCIDYGYAAPSGTAPATLVTEPDHLLGTVPNIGLRLHF
jgi:outer membrane cobalamin receptor